MATKDDERRWRRALRKRGLDFVRRRLDVAHTAAAPEAEVREVVDDPPHPDRRFVESWHRAEGKRLERRKALWWRAAGLVVLLVAAAGALALVVRWL